MFRLRRMMAAVVGAALIVPLIPSAAQAQARLMDPAVTLEVVAVNGSGCPANSSVTTDVPDKTAFSVSFSQFKVPGMAMVNVVIAKNGHVSSATTTGKFAGTPSGSCVERAVKSASFPPSDGLSTPYPFQLK